MSARCLPICKYCGIKFVPDARNRDRQLICGRSDCRGAASRAKKRRCYRLRIKREEGFRESERVRCREAMRESRRKAKERSPPASPPDPPCPHELLAGLVSQLGGTSDPVEVAAMMNVYADRGRRLAVAARLRAPPG